MEIDQSSRRAPHRGRGASTSAGQETRGSRGGYGSARGGRGGRGRGRGRGGSNRVPPNVENLDMDLDNYMLRDTKTGRSVLDNDLDSYMQGAV